MGEPTPDKDNSRENLLHRIYVENYHQKWYGQYSDVNEAFHWTWFSVFLSTILGLLVFGTIVGNFSILLHSFQKWRKLGYDTPPTHFFLANLAVADFLVGLLVLPFLLVMQVTGKWYFGQCLCTAWVCTHFWLCAASLLSTCAVCVERYIGVKHPLHHRMYLTPARIFWGIQCVWVLAGIPSTVRVFAWSQAITAHPYQCIINQKLEHAILAWLWIFCIPSLMMLSLYYYIYKRAMRHLLDRRNGLSMSTTSISDNSSKTLDEYIKSSKPDGKAFEEAIRRKQFILSRKLSILVGVVIFSYGPYFTLILLKSINPLWVNPKVFDVFAWLRYSNSFINPYIYAYTTKYFGFYNKCYTFLKKKGSQIVRKNTQNLKDKGQG